MLVPTMTLQEIRKSVLNDYEVEINNKLEFIRINYTGKWIRNGRKDFVETIVFPVKSRNNWRITITCNKNGVSTTPYLISYDNHGITASHLLPEHDEIPLMHFNSHFFKRYMERGKIEIDKPEQLVKFFFRKNSWLIPCYLPREDGTQQLFIPLIGGVGLGNYYPEGEIYEFKTFVDNSLLGQNQKDQIGEIYTETLKALTAEIQQRLDKKKNQGPK